MSSAQNLFFLERPPVDFAILNSLAEAQGEGEPDLIVELIDLFLADTPGRAATMREALADCDHSRLARAAHALKGSSSTMGAVLVAKTCGELEVLAQERSFLSVAVVLERLEAELASLQNALLIERNARVGELDSPVDSHSNAKLLVSFETWPRLK